MTAVRRFVVVVYLTMAAWCGLVVVAGVTLGEPAPANARTLVIELGDSCSRPCRFPQLAEPGRP